MSRKRDTVVIYSGGMDSLTLAALTRAQGRLHSCLSFNYGQKHARELEYARVNCTSWHIPHIVIDLTTLAPCLTGSALTDDTPVPTGHYADDNMKLTVVPNRNMIMLSIAIAYAVSHKLEEVRYGAHAGDHTIYPDCRPEFTHDMNWIASRANWSPVRVVAPFQHDTKETILRLGYSLAVDYEYSWTCYKGEEDACGKCGSCTERLEAFKAIGIADPLRYVAGVR